MSSETILTNGPEAASMRDTSHPYKTVISRIPTALLIVYSLMLALGLGLGSTYWALNNDPPFGSIHLGPWKVWPTMGSPDADPYMRAILARRGEVPLASGEGLGFTATADSEGRNLDSACTYRIGTSAPGARLWTVTLYDRDGRLPATPLGRSSFTSAEIIRDGQDGFNIALSRDLQEGNWLQLPASGSFSIVMRLYDPQGALGSLDEAEFPTIQRGGCGS
jgi:hypothetical protein